MNCVCRHGWQPSALQRLAWGAAHMAGTAMMRTGRTVEDENEEAEMAEEEEDGEAGFFGRRRS